MVNAYIYPRLVFSNLKMHSTTNTALFSPSFLICKILTCTSNLENLLLDFFFFTTFSTADEATEGIIYVSKMPL